MKLNNKGFTLIELMAVVFVLGIIMAVTIPNIVGISNQNKIISYAEDAKKFKNSVEYMLRGDDTVVKPTSNGQCVLVNLGYLHGNEYDTPPYGGQYLMDYSYVVMVKKDNRYYYYVQLIEEIPDSGGYRGYQLIETSQLEGDKYIGKDLETTSISSFLNLGVESNRSASYVKDKIEGRTGCSSVLNVYYAMK